MATVYHAGSFLKASIDGVNGSGKSGTTARLAVGISKELCGSTQVVAYSSDDRWRIYKRTIFDVENVPLTVISGESLNQVSEATEYADKEQCCVLVCDDLTVPWKEGLATFSESDGYLSFEKREQLMNEWRPLLRAFRLGVYHAIGVGRIGYEWANVEDDAGRMRLVQGNSKFNAGGGENFGYEADVELEMYRNKRRIRELLRMKTRPEYLCDVIKDAGPGMLNGQQFVFPGQQGLYKPGDYKEVFNCFRPYIEFMGEVAGPAPVPSSTRQLIVSGKTPWAKDQTERKGLLEELDANLGMCFPSGEGKSKLAKMFRDLTLENLNGFISWSRMEEETSTELMRDNLYIVKKLRTHIDRGEVPTGQNSLITLLYICREEVLHPGRDLSLLEVMGKKSVESITSGKKQQATGD